MMMISMPRVSALASAAGAEFMLLFVYVCVQAEETSVASTSDESFITAELKAIYATKREWTWRGYSIGYTVQGCGPPVLLVHGFGASIGHWRRYKARLKSVAEGEGVWKERGIAHLDSAYVCLDLKEILLP